MSTDNHNLQNNPGYLDPVNMHVVQKAYSTNLIPLAGKPTVNIAGTDFYVEINTKALIEVEDPTNVIYFKYMQDKGDHYEFQYHPRWKNLPCQLDDPKEGIDVNIPPLVSLDPQGMAKKYNIDIGELKGRKDIEFLNPNYRGFLRRVAGELPTINIAGDEYIIDLAKSELRLQGTEDKCLSFCDFESFCFLDEVDFGYRFIYDMVQKKVVADSGNASSKCVVVELPEKIDLDPVWLARKNGEKDEAYIQDNPVRENMVAVIRNLEGKQINSVLGTTKGTVRERQKGNRI